MEKKAAVICGTASLLGLLAVILGFVGEGTKSQVILTNYHRHHPLLL
jgi:hypothetical protein